MDRRKNVYTAPEEQKCQSGSFVENGLKIDTP